MECEHEWKKEDGFFVLFGGIQDLEQENIFRCLKCKETEYRKTGNKIDLIKISRSDE